MGEVKINSNEENCTLEIAESGIFELKYRGIKGYMSGSGKISIKYDIGKEVNPEENEIMICPLEKQIRFYIESIKEKAKRAVVLNGFTPNYNLLQSPNK